MLALWVGGTSPHLACVLQVLRHLYHVTFLISKLVKKERNPPFLLALHASASVTLVLSCPFISSVRIVCTPLYLGRAAFPLLMNYQLWGRFLLNLCHQGRIVVSLAFFYLDPTIVNIDVFWGVICKSRLAENQEKALELLGYNVEATSKLRIRKEHWFCNRHCKLC